jgi:hypothetical protein
VIFHLLTLILAFTELARWVLISRNLSSQSSWLIATQTLSMFYFSKKSPKKQEIQTKMRTI